MDSNRQKSPPRHVSERVFVIVKNFSFFSGISVGFRKFIIDPMESRRENQSADSADLSHFRLSFLSPSIDASADEKSGLVLRTSGSGSVPGV